MRNRYKNTVKELWHDSYWDYPLSGLALYKGDKVYFNTIYGSDSITITKDEPINRVLLNILPSYIIDYIKKHLYDEEVDIFNATDEEYEAGPDKDFRECGIMWERGIINVCIGPKYQLYKMSDNILQIYESNHKLFEKCMGDRTQINSGMDKYNNEKIDINIKDHIDNFEKIEKIYLSDFVAKG